MDDTYEIAAKKRRGDFIALQDEDAGRDTGQLRRFVPEHAARSALRQRQEHDGFMTFSLPQQVSWADDRFRKRITPLDRLSAEALVEADRRVE